MKLEYLPWYIDGHWCFLYLKAFIYVGVYGYPYVEAGKKVMTLFTERGWTVVINDNLVSGALGLMSFTIALLSACTTSLIIVSDEVGVIFT